MEGHTAIKTMNPMIAYQKGLTTWAKWVDLNLDPHKTRVFFRSMSPRHNRYHTEILYAAVNKSLSLNFLVWRSAYVVIFWQAKWLEML